LPAALAALTADAVAAMGVTAALYSPRTGNCQDPARSRTPIGVATQTASRSESILHRFRRCREWFAIPATPHLKMPDGAMPPPRKQVDQRPLLLRPCFLRETPLYRDAITYKHCIENITTMAAVFPTRTSNSPSPSVSACEPPPNLGAPEERRQR
jgi:hypothetical protein